MNRCAPACVSFTSAPMKRTWDPNSSYAWRRRGASDRHGPHQEAQTLTTTGTSESLRRAVNASGDIVGSGSTDVAVDVAAQPLTITANTIRMSKKGRVCDIAAAWYRDSGTEQSCRSTPPLGSSQSLRTHFPLEGAARIGSAVSLA